MLKELNYPNGNPFVLFSVTTLDNKKMYCLAHNYDIAKTKAQKWFVLDSKAGLNAEPLMYCTLLKHFKHAKIREILLRFGDKWVLS